MEVEDLPKFQAKIKEMSLEELTALSAVLRRKGMDAAEEVRVLHERVQERSMERRHQHRPGEDWEN